MRADAYREMGTGRRLQDQVAEGRDPVGPMMPSNYLTTREGFSTLDLVREEALFFLDHVSKNFNGLNHH
jgi:hypothetical protein